MAVAAEGRTPILRSQAAFFRSACLWAVASLFCVSLFALDPQRDIHQFAHRSWGEKDGYPGQPRTMAQTMDGFLWIGTFQGLYRFDGVHIERYRSRLGDELPDFQVSSLLALPDGSLWIGFGYGGRISVLRNGYITNYPEAIGLPTETAILSIVRDHEGAMWASTGAGLIRFNGSQWERIGGGWNLSQEMQHIRCGALFVDSNGTLWAGMGNTIMYLRHGSRRFEPTGAYAGVAASFGETSDGRIWLDDVQSAVRVIGTSVSTKSSATARCEVLADTLTTRCPSDGQLGIRISAYSIVFDHNGGLWMATGADGLLRVPDPLRLKNRSIPESDEELQRFNEKDGLSADRTVCIVEDREGNIWVATRDGLDQFRDTRLVPIVFPTSTEDIGLAPADGGDVWVTSNFSRVARIHGGSTKVPLEDADAYDAYRDTAGVTWLLGSRVLERWENGRFKKVADVPPGVVRATGEMQIVSDESGTLWAFAKGIGFLTLDQHRWKVWPTPPQVARQQPAVAFCDSTGRIWIGTYSGDIVTMNKGNIVTYSPQTNSLLHSGSNFTRRGSAVLLSNSHGLLLFENGHFSQVGPKDWGHFSFIEGIVDAGSAGIWMIADEGVIHIPSSEIEESLRDHAHRFQWERFDSTDGLPGKNQRATPYPHVIQGTDGRIWFVTTKGVAWIDPRKISRNTTPPPVSITSVLADGSTHSQLADLGLPARTANVQINYSVLSLTVPEKDQIRYKLDGIDKDWQDPGTKREALYSRLPPGRYQFHVIASNNDGVWNKTGATLSFAIAPAWFQTIWFEFLVAAAVLTLVWIAYTIRMRQVTANIQERLGTQMKERERIARELHDTLLQSFQGLTLHFQRARNLLPDRAAEAIQTLDKALDGAEEAIVEGRDAIHDLRASMSASKALEVELTALGEELAAKDTNEKEPVKFRMIVEGSAHELQPNAYVDIFRIAREAIRNAFAHSQGHLIETEIAYTESLFRLRIRDDGKGIDLDERARAEQTGHWGLKGMRERAERLGGQLDVWSEPGVGTEIELRVPATTVYEVSASQSSFRPFWNRKKSDDT